MSDSSFSNLNFFFFFLRFSMVENWISMSFWALGDRHQTSFYTPNNWLMEKCLINSCLIINNLVAVQARIHTSYLLSYPKSDELISIHLIFYIIHYYFKKWSNVKNCTKLAVFLSHCFSIKSVVWNLETMKRNMIGNWILLSVTEFNNFTCIAPKKCSSKCNSKRNDILGSASD